MFSEATVDEDRTAKARIRDAAIECFAASGVDGTSIRTIAGAASVSPGLVIHHFGTKDGLRVACDQYVAARIREQKAGAMAQGAGFDPLASLRGATSGPPIIRYLARTLVDGSPHVAELVDELIADAVAYIDVGVESGLLTPSEHPRERAALITLWSLGGLVLHEHMTRHLGVDITGDAFSDPAAAWPYVGAALDVFSGFITDTTRQVMSAAFSGASPSNEQKETDR